MTRQRSAVGKLSTGLLLLTALVISPCLYAGDEDMSPNAYHIFDPETGYMVTVESQPDAQQGQSMTAIDPNAEAEQADEEGGNFTVLQRWIFLLAVILLAGGYAVRKRSKEYISRA